MEKEKRNIILKTLLIIFLCALIFLAIFLPLKLTGALDKINSIDKLKEVIASGGGYSYLIFFAVQFLQTTFVPIPAFITTSAGAILFGPWIGFLISMCAVILGSLFSFFLGRKLGRKAVYFVAGEKSGNKWLEKLEKGKYVFFLMMLFPVFPDDILCLVAGVTTMSLKFFIVTNLISRSISLLCICFLGSGILIPFSGWGIPVWILFIIFAIIAFILTIKYQDKIESFVTKLGEKITLKKHNKSTNTTKESSKMKENSNDKKTK